jgi:hypothetical protein
VSIDERRHALNVSMRPRRIANVWRIDAAVGAVRQSKSRRTAREQKASDQT